MNPIQKVTTKIVLHQISRFVDNEGRFPVKLQVTFKRTQRQYSIPNHRYTPEEFSIIMDTLSKREQRDRGLNRIFSASEKKQIKAYLDKVQEHADSIIIGMVNFDFDNFKAILKGEPGKSKNKTIKNYFKEKENELISLGKISTADGYKATYISLEKFDKQIGFHKITPRYLKKFETWYVTEGRSVHKGKEKRGGSYTTVGIYMRNLRHIVNLALKDGNIKEYPFGEGKDKYQIPVSNNIKKALTLNEIGALFNYSSDVPQEMISLKYWLFSYLCNGMNFVDMLNLKYSNINDDRLTFIRQKTKDTSKHKTKIEVVLLPQTLKIIESLGNKDRSINNYIFPILHSGLSPSEQKKLVAQHIQTTNKYIKRIASKLGITNHISTYYARHSYSTIIRDSGASTEFIAEQLGHQSTKVTQNYLDSFSSETKKKFQQAIVPDIAK